MYLFFKSLHIVGFVAWFAGLFYLVRIFVYHSESNKFDKNIQSIFNAQYNLMQWRVYKIICTPAMIITWSFGLLMIYNNGWEWFKVNYWLHYKLGLLLGMVAYHFYCKKLIIYLEKGELPMKSFQFRLFNEIPSLFLVLIVLIAVFQNNLNWKLTGVGMLLFILFMFIAAKTYNRWRTNKDSKC